MKTNIENRVTVLKPYVSNEYCSDCNHCTMPGVCKGGYAHSCIWSDVAWPGSTDHWIPKNNENN